MKQSLHCHNITRLYVILVSRAQSYVMVCIHSLKVGVCSECVVHTGLLASDFRPFRLSEQSQHHDRPGTHLLARNARTHEKL